MKIILLLTVVFGLGLWPATAICGEEKIAYTRMYNGFWQVWETEIGNSEAKLLTDSQIDKSYPDWAPDGKRLAYVTNTGELWVISVSDKKSFKIPVVIPVSEPKWSADGKRILFMSPKDVFRDDTDIWVADINGKNLLKITKRPWAQFNPAWLPNEDEVLFVDSPEILGEEICRIDIKSEDIIRITHNKFNDIQPLYLTNEGKIVYASNQSGNYDIWIMDKFGQNAKSLTNDPTYDIMPRASLDGKTIYFISDRSGYLQIFKIDLQTNKLRQITFDDGDKKDFAVYAK